MTDGVDGPHAVLLAIDLGDGLVGNCGSQGARVQQFTAVSRRFLGHVARFYAASRAIFQKVVWWHAVMVERVY
jgi:hypothetical protein